MRIAMSAVISATPSADQSMISLPGNASALLASGQLVFSISPFDSTGLRILDAPDTPYQARLLNSEGDGRHTPCSVSNFHGECDLPALRAGGFALEVLGSDGSPVGGGSGRFNFTVAQCPATYFLDDEDAMCKCAAGSYDTGFECETCASGEYAEKHGASECRECAFPTTSNANHTECTDCEATYYRDAKSGGCLLCPTQVECARGSAITDWVLEPGVWRSTTRSTELYECRFGDVSCPGVNASDDDCSASGFGDWPHCACGYEGPTCSVCAHGYFQDFGGDSCADCGSGDAHTPSIVVGALVLLFFGAVGLLLRKSNFKKFACYIQLKKILKLGRTKLSILFFLCQVISTFSSISDDTGKNGHPEPAASFAAALGATNVDFLQVACSPAAPQDPNPNSNSNPNPLLAVRAHVMRRIWRDELLLGHGGAHPYSAGRHRIALAVASQLLRPRQAAHPSFQESGQAHAARSRDHHAKGGHQRHASIFLPEV